MTAITTVTTVVLVNRISAQIKVIVTTVLEFAIVMKDIKDTHAKVKTFPI